MPTFAIDTDPSDNAAVVHQLIGGIFGNGFDECNVR
jgi:hypothetical protein